MSDPLSGMRIGQLQATRQLHHDLYAAIDPTKELKDACKGRTVLVTGGSKGCGQAIAIAYAQAGAASIHLTARESWLPDL